MRAVRKRTYGLQLIAFCLLFSMLFIVAAPFALADDKDGKHTISGYITDNTSGEELIGASLYIKELKAGTSTNVYGFYSLTIPEGKYEILFSYLGYNDLTKTVDLTKDVKLDVGLTPKAEILETVEIVGERKDQNIQKIEMSVAKIPMVTVKKMPAFLGEVDIIKTIMLLPGVASGAEGSTGFHVRGGSADQNLILLDGAPVYNASHFVGFFSVFNGDAIKDFKLYKGGIPAEFGGRLSSVLDIHMKEGNSKKLSATGGIGVLASRLTIEGPIIKDKCSFIVSGRRTYFDVFLPLSPDTNVRKASIFFYDLNAKLNYKINDNNKIFVSGYFGKDVEGFGDIMGIQYGNGTGSLRWNHLFNSKLFMNVTYIYSKYNYLIHAGIDDFSIDWRSEIKDNNLKVDLSYFMNQNNTIKFGISSIYHTFDPGELTFELKGTDPMEIKLQHNYAFEHAAYIQNEQKISPLLSILYGVRYSAFQNYNPKNTSDLYTHDNRITWDLDKNEQDATVYSYDRSDPYENYEVNDSALYAPGTFYNTYGGFEPRLGIRYILNESSSMKASYNRTLQYLHLATNTSASTPLDYWFPCSPNIEPQKADQVALGYFRNLKNNMIETSIEVYYKKMNNVIDFKDHAETLLNEMYEGEVRIGKAYSYGAEFLVKKQEGKFTGWLSYTISRTRRKIEGINNGNEYFASYDKTHDVSVILSYDLTKKLNISASWVYSTAQPRTMPTGRYEYGNLVVPVYSDRNSVRIFPYHRLDLSSTFYFNKYGEVKTRKNGKPKKKYESSLNISIYNAYARKNPISINFVQSDVNPSGMEAEMMYLFKIIPSLTYNFKF